MNFTDYVIKRGLIRIFLLFIYSMLSFCTQGQDTIYIEDVEQQIILNDTTDLRNYYELLKKRDINERFKSDSIEESYLDKGIKYAEAMKGYQLLYLFLQERTSGHMGKNIEDTIYYNKLLEVIPKLNSLNNDCLLSTVYNRIAATYGNNNQYAKALSFFIKSRNTSCNSRVSSKNMGILYRLIGNNERSRFYFNDYLTHINDGRASISDRNFYKRKMGVELEIAKSYKDENRKLFIDFVSKAITSKNKFVESMANDVEFHISHNFRAFSFYFYLYSLKEEGLPINETHEEIIADIKRHISSSKESKYHYTILLFQEAVRKKDIQTARSIYMENASRYSEEIPKICIKYFSLIGDYRKAMEYQEKAYDLEIASLALQTKNQIILADIAQTSKEKELAINKLLTQTTAQESRAKVLSLTILCLLLLSGLLLLFGYYRRIKRLQLEQELNDKNIIIQQAEELNKVDALRNRLFSNFSHELRTPISLILGRLKQLRNKKDANTDSQESIDQIITQCNEVNGMVTQILELSQLENNQIEITNKRVKALDLANYITSVFADEALRRNIQLKTDFEFDTSIEIVTDIGKVITILKNLFSNALKYSQPGDEIFFYQTLNEDRTKLRFSLKDTGQGIAVQDIPNIFDRYYQAKSSAIVPEGGFGIGLAICKEYSRLLGVSLSVESELNIGSTFTLGLPVVTDQPINQNYFTLPNSISLTKTIAQKATDYDDFILIVEDNFEMANYLSQLLEDEYKIMVTHNGREAIKVLERHRPKLILTDLMMPTMDGMKMIEHIKSNKKWNNIPILILTAKDNVLDELKATRVGVDGYLKKPFNDTELLSNLDNLLSFADERTLISEESKYPESVDSIIQTSYDKGVSSADKRWLEIVEEEIASIVNDMNLNIEQMALKLDTSPTTLTRRMKRLTGLTPKRYVNEIRMLKGRKMLETKEYHSVKAVAYSVGFKSEKVFSRKFKIRFGTYPSDVLKK